MPLDIMTLREWKEASRHWSQSRNPSHGELREIDSTVQRYHTIAKDQIEARIGALNEIVAKSARYVEHKDTSSLLPFLQARREKKAAAMDVLHGQAQALLDYLAAVLGVERSLPAKFGVGDRTPAQRAATPGDRFRACAKQVLGLQRYLGTGDGRRLHEDYWTEALDPQHRNWDHPSNQPIFREWVRLRHEQSSTRLPFYRWFETLNEDELRRLAPTGLLQTAYQDARGREQYRVYVGTDHQLKKLAAPERMQSFSTAEHTTNFAGQGWAIFVISPAGELYANSHDDVEGWFHSAFLGGKPVMAAGELFVKDGVLHAMTPKSGHYKPRAAELIDGLKHLREEGLDLTNTQVMAFKLGADGKGLTAKGGGTLCEWYDAVPYIESDGREGLLRTEGITKQYRLVWNPDTNEPQLIEGDEWLDKNRFRGWTHPA